MNPVGGKLVRVVEADIPAFQLKPGEPGLSVFDLDAIDPPLTEQEILDQFRPGSSLLVCPVADIEAKGLQVVVTPGAEFFPERLRQAHREIVPGAGMTRKQFKAALKELE